LCGTPYRANAPAPEAGKKDTIMSASNFEAELDRLLSVSLDDAIDREATAFEELTAPAKGALVIYGAGNLGRLVASGLRAHGIEPVAFADGSPTLWGSRIEGVPVLSPSDAAARYGTSAAFIVSIYSPGADRRYTCIRKILQDLGCRWVLSFLPFFWKHSAEFLPYFKWDLPHRLYQAADKVREVYSLWGDDASRREYVGQVAWLLSTMDFDGLPMPDDGPTYLPTDVFSLTGQEHFVDCGAFDGDTIRTFLECDVATHGAITALEPDPGNFQRLQLYVDALPAEMSQRIQIHPFAVGARREVLHFEALGSLTSSISNTGSIEVECVPLDELLAGAHPTYIKMDIEGAEPAALEGGRATIERATPALAICVYHRQEHLWELPLLMRAFSNDYRFFLRRYVDEFGDLVCYAAPSARVHG